MRYAFIERHEKVWPITVQCRVLDVSASGYHQHRVRGEAPDQPHRRISDMALVVHIRAVFAEMKGAYGWLNLPLFSVSLSWAIMRRPPRHCPAVFSRMPLG